MEKKNILILGVGGNVSQGILKAIKQSNIQCNLIGACINEESLGLYLCDKSYISPLASSEKFISWLIDICNKENIDMIMTGVEENILEIAKNYETVKNNTKAIFKFTDYSKLLIGQNKIKTCEWLKENGFNYPKYCKSNDENALEKLIDSVGYPLIAKPIYGKGSNGIIKINNSDDIEKIRTIKDYVIQEYIGSEDTEYTVGCYCDKNGKFVDAIIMKRELKLGTTFKAEVVENDKIYNEVSKICNKFIPVGPLNIQLRLNSNGEPVCFETNVRFSGTTPIRANFGYNDVAAMLKEYLFDMDINDEFNIKKGIAYRYLNELYIDNETQLKLETEGFIDNTKGCNSFTDNFGSKL